MSARADDNLEPMRHGTITGQAFMLPGAIRKRIQGRANDPLALLLNKEAASGSNRERPELAKCLDVLRSGDPLKVWRLDRLGRSLTDLVGMVSDLEARGVAFSSLNEAINTGSAGGKLIFHVFAALAEFERSLNPGADPRGIGGSSGTASQRGPAPQDAGGSGAQGEGDVAGPLHDKRRGGAAFQGDADDAEQGVGKWRVERNRDSVDASTKLSCHIGTVSKHSRQGLGGNHAGRKPSSPRPALDMTTSTVRLVSILEHFGDLTSRSLEFSNRPDIPVSYGEETITQTKLLELRHCHSDVVQIRTFSKAHESKVNSDWGVVHCRPAAHSEDARASKATFSPDCTAPRPDLMMPARDSLGTLLATGCDSVAHNIPPSVITGAAE